MSYDFGRSEILLSQAVDFVSKNGGGIRTIEASTEFWLRHSIGNFSTAVGDLRISQVTAQQIYNYHQEVEARASAVTANNYLRAIRIVFNRLVKNGWLKENPANHVPYLHEPPSIPRAIQPETYYKMREAADVRERAIIDLLWESGCRISGLRSILVKDVKIWRHNGEPRFTAVVREKGKVGKRRGSRKRKIFARGEAVLSIEQWLEEKPKGEYLFCSLRTGRPIGKDAIQTIGRKLRKKASIQPDEIANFHSFRHAFALRKLDEGCDIALVSQWLGHADPAFTAKTYCIRNEKQLEDAFFN